MLRLKRGKSSKDRRQSHRVDHQVLVYVAEREHCALAADQIVMDKDAILGAVDPQLIEQNRSLPAVSLVSIPRLKPWEQIDDATLVMIGAGVQTDGPLSPTRWKIHQQGWLGGS